MTVSKIFCDDINPGGWHTNFNYYMGEIYEWVEYALRSEEKCEVTIRNNSLLDVKEYGLQQLVKRYDKFDGYECHKVDSKLNTYLFYKKQYTPQMYMQIVNDIFSEFYENRWSLQQVKGRLMELSIPNSYYKVALKTAEDTETRNRLEAAAADIAAASGQDTVDIMKYTSQIMQSSISKAALDAMNGFTSLGTALNGLGSSATNAIAEQERLEQELKSIGEIMTNTPWRRSNKNNNSAQITIGGHIQRNGAKVEEIKLEFANPEVKEQIQMVMEMTGLKFGQVVEILAKDDGAEQIERIAIARETDNKPMEREFDFDD